MVAIWLSIAAAAADVALAADLAAEDPGDGAFDRHADHIPHLADREVVVGERRAGWQEHELGPRRLQEEEQHAGGEQDADEQVGEHVGDRVADELARVAHDHEGHPPGQLRADRVDLGQHAGQRVHGALSYSRHCSQEACPGGPGGRAKGEGKREKGNGKR
jgi:hypothetical protein